MGRRQAAMFLSVVLTATLAAAQVARHPFSFADAAALRRAEAKAVSPDGKTILYDVAFGGAKGPENHEWRLISATGGAPRNLSLPDKFEPAGFTRDGNALYGTYEVNKMGQLAAFPLAPANTPAAAAATPTPITALPRGIQAALISPDGSRYAVLADPRLPDPLADLHTVIEAQPSSLYVVNADGSGGQWWCPALRQIASGLTSGGLASLAWSPDGTEIAVLSQTPKIGFHDVRSYIDVCSARASRRLATISNAAAGIAWVDGSKELAFLSTTTPVLSPDHVWTIPATGGAPVDRTPGLKGSALGLSADGKGNAWVLVARGVQTEVDDFKNDALETRYRWTAGAVDAPVAPQLASAPESLAFTVADPEHASNVAVAHGSDLRKITNEGDELLGKISLGEVRAVHWTSKEGVPLEGIVTFPADYNPKQHYPFVVFPHGGPEANDLLNLDAFARSLAGIGYVVLQPEYRGSTGYGSDFLAAIYQHFGDRAYSDVDSATDYAVAQGWADPNRLAIFGWSAGGFMTSWTVTQTHRYKAAVEGAGITDWPSFIWTSDVQQTDFDARWPDQDPTAFLRFSAVMHSADVTTPLLILHGAADERVPTYQGRELFEVLLARGKTTRMVTYPGSPHFPRLWEQRQDVFREIAAWLAKYNP